MAMNFFKWLFGKNEAVQVTGDEFFSLQSDVYIRQLAFMSCVNLMGNALSKCRVQTFSGGREVNGPESYLWNYAPNQNQNASAFWNKLVFRLFRDGAALVVENNRKLYVADSYARTKYAMYDDIFRQVTVDNFTFGRAFTRSEVLFFEMSSMDARKVVDGIYQSYGKLISYGMNGYQKSRGQHGTLELDAMAAGDKAFMESYQNIQNGGFAKFAEADNAILPLYKGMKYTDLSQKTYNSDTTRDIRALIDDVTDFTARGYGIPPALLNGSVQDVSSATEQFLTFAVDPTADMIETEIVRQRYGYDAMARGDLLRIDTGGIRHVDILKESSSIDKLIGSGAFCVNDVRRRCGQTVIDEPWAWQHFMTKNYAAAKDVLNAAEKTG